MKHLPTLCALAAVLALSACNSSRNAHNHWSGNYVSTSMTRAFFGWVPRNSKETGQYLKRDLENAELIVYRHVLSSNPENPLQGD